MSSSPLTSRSLKDRLTKVPDWFRPKNPMVAAYAEETLRSFQKREQKNAERVAAVKTATLPKAAEIIRNYNVRAKSFLGGKTFPWTSDSWECIQLDRFRRKHPVRFYFWRMTGLLAPTF